MQQVDGEGARVLHQAGTQGGLSTTGDSRGNNATGGVGTVGGKHFRWPLLRRSWQGRQGWQEWWQRCHLLQLPDGGAPDEAVPVPTGSISTGAVAAVAGSTDFGTAFSAGSATSPTEERVRWSGSALSSSSDEEGAILESRLFGIDEPDECSEPGTREGDDLPVSMNSTLVQVFEEIEKSDGDPHLDAWVWEDLEALPEAPSSSWVPPYSSVEGARELFAMLPEPLQWWVQKCEGVGRLGKSLAEPRECFA